MCGILYGSVQRLMPELSMVIHPEFVFVVCVHNYYYGYDSRKDWAEPSMGQGQD